jgi:acyl-coenzyme A synthetase/AMP-(fatty) acid ligase
MTHEHFNLALTQEAVSAAVPDREYLIWRDRRFTYRQLTERSRRLASFLHQRGSVRTPNGTGLLATNLAKITSLSACATATSSSKPCGVRSSHARCR